MKILLIGEYSRLHNTLKEGLIVLNHEVTLVGNGDGFKNYPIDINVDAKFFRKPFFFLLAKALHKLTNISLIELECAYRFHKALPILKDYDVVQLINENAIKTNPFFEKRLLKKIFKQNKKTFLLSCGTDYISVKYAYERKYRYSILTPWFHDPKLTEHYKFILRHLTLSYYQLHLYIYKNVQGVISSDLDYHIPLINHPKYLGMIPNPINLNKIVYLEPKFATTIKIFHGINSLSYTKKGNVFFDEALKIIKLKYPDQVEIITSKDIPYNDYIKIYDSCHILLDQVYAYDQGYNALEAMAKGKVVFTGAEQEWLDHYHLKQDTVAINALPNAQKIAEKLEWLILNPTEIVKISKNARAFIEKEHNYLNVALKYISVWNKN